MKRVQLTQSVFDGKNTFEAGTVAELDDTFAAKVVERECGVYEDVSVVEVTATDVASVSATDVRKEN